MSNKLLKAITSRVYKAAPIKREGLNACVFCGSNMGTAEIFRSEAAKLAEGLVRLDVGMVYGGASVGVMGLLADTMMKANGRVIGVIPTALVDREVAHKGLTELRVVRNMHERKKMMFDLSDFFVTFPGGFGTLDETFEMITWKQIGIHQKPVLLMNIDGYFNPLIEFVDKAVAAGFIKQEHRQFFDVVRSAEEALQKLSMSLGR